MYTINDFKIGNTILFKDSYNSKQLGIIINIIPKLDKIVVETKNGMMYSITASDETTYNPHISQRKSSITFDNIIKIKELTEKTMIKLKEGQKVIGEDGNLYEIEKGDILVESDSKDLAKIKKELTPLDLTVSFDRDSNEFRVNFKGGKEATAYYTNEVEDAIATGKHMAKEKK